MSNPPRKSTLTCMASVIAVTLSVPALAADPVYPTLVHSQDGSVVHNNYQECWGTGPNNVSAQPNRECLQAPPPPAPVVIAPAPAPLAVAAPAPVVAAPVGAGPAITLSADALFDFNKAVLKPEGKALIHQELRKTQFDGGQVEVRSIRVVGYTDAIGSRAYNQKLSLRRAEAVKGYLVREGIAADRIHCEGKGSNDPVASNKTKEGRAKNRRADIWFDQR